MKEEVEGKMISIIVPLEENCDFEETLNSIKKQTYTNYEVIFVGDESIEQEIISSKKYSFVKTDTEGFINKCIVGLKKAKGDYCTILSLHDYVSIDLYRAMIYKAVATKSDIVFSNIVEYKNEDEKVSFNMLNQPQKELVKEQCFDAYFKQNGLNRLWNIVSNKIYSKKIINRVIEKFASLTQEFNETFIFNYFVFKEAEIVNKIDNDVLYYSEVKCKHSHEEIVEIFKIIEDDIDVTKYKDDIQRWKNLYSEKDGSLKSDFNPNYEEVKDRNYFYIIDTWWNDGLEKIKKAIIANKTKLVSFDIFDTLVVRPFLYPTDLFDVVDKYFRKLTKNKTATEFKSMREDSEKLARKIKSQTNGSMEDVTLDEIYDAMQKRYRISDEVLLKLKEYELEQELRFCVKRETTYELYEMIDYLGKRMICTSDMYLSSEFLSKILNKQGYDKIAKVYVSNEYGKTKATGSLYKKVCEEEQVLPTAVVHIGDNYISDVEHAKKNGLRAFHLAKPVDLFCDKNYTGCLSAMFIEHLPFWEDNANAFNFNGIRAMVAMAANRYFDNPYKPFKEKSDFNADPYLIGYFNLGSYMFGLSKWILDDVQYEDYEKLVFMARDGYLPIKCYAIMKKYYEKQPQEEYLYISRKALIPIIIQDKMDFYKLVETLNIEKNTPLTIFKYVRELINFDDKRFISECKKRKLNANAKLKTMEEFNTVIDIIIDKFYDKEKHEYSMKIFKDYFKNIYGNHSATFDIGYSARPSYFISNLLGRPIDTYFCNINHNQALRHSEMGGFKLKTFFEAKPSTIGHAYEMLLSALAPSCIAYEIKDGKVVEKFEDYSVSSTVSWAINTMQGAAQEFVKNMCETFNEDIDVLMMQNYYAGLPFLAYMNSSKEIDKYPFSSVLFEDDLSIGGSQKMVRVWGDELKQKNQYNMPSLLNLKDKKDTEDFFTGNRLVYNSNINLEGHSKIMRLLFYILYDRETFNRRIDEIKHHFWNKDKK